MENSYTKWRENQEEQGKDPFKETEDQIKVLQGFVKNNQDLVRALMVFNIGKDLIRTITDQNVNWSKQIKDLQTLNLNNERTTNKNDKGPG